MSNEQKLTDMIEYYRNKLSEESLRNADIYATAISLQRQLDEKDERINDLNGRLNEYIQEENNTPVEPATN